MCNKIYMKYRKWTILQRMKALNGVKLAIIAIDWGYSIDYYTFFRIFAQNNSYSNICRWN